MKRYFFSRVESIAGAASLACLLFCGPSSYGAAPDSVQVAALADRAKGETDVSKKLAILGQLMSVDSPEAATRVVDVIRTDEFVLAKWSGSASNLAVPAPAMTVPLLDLFHAKTSSKAARIITSSRALRGPWPQWTL
jgi:hypothetical protein